MGASSGKSEIRKREANIYYHPTTHLIFSHSLTHPGESGWGRRERGEKVVEPQNRCSVFHTWFPINHQTVIQTGNYQQQGCTEKVLTCLPKYWRKIPSKHGLGRAKPTVENTNKKCPLLLALSLLLALCLIGFLKLCLCPRKYNPFIKFFPNQMHSICPPEDLE